jgi:glycogenin glucosyltransferase
MAVPDTQAWVTLATTDAYAVGGLVLANSLRRAATNRKKVILVTNSVSQALQ